MDSGFLVRGNWIPNPMVSRIPGFLELNYGFQSPGLRILQTKFSEFRISKLILLHEKLLQFDWLRAVVFQPNLKYLHVKITNLLRVVVNK